MLLERNLQLTRARIKPSDLEGLSERFAITGPKIGKTINLKIPPLFTQPAELTLSIRDFSERVLRPQLDAMRSGDRAEAPANLIRHSDPDPLNFIAEL